MLSNCKHSSFRNLNSTVPVDVVLVKSYVDSLLNPLSPNIHIQILQTDLYTFPKE